MVHFVADMTMTSLPNPPALRDPQLLKRRSTDTGDDLSGLRPVKRMRQDEEARSRQAQRRHYIHHRQTVPPSSRIGDEEARFQLTRAIGVALKQAGFDGADGVAIEGFHSRVEEYMDDFASHISQSMLSCRRARPIPQDFAHALRRGRLSFDELTPHLRHVVPARAVIPPLPSPPPEESLPQSLAHVDRALSGRSAQNVALPAHFPPLPGQHTYKDTSVFTERDFDPRKLREKATEEGRLGEEALRGLLAASSHSIRNATKAFVKKQSKTFHKAGWWQGGEDAHWEKTLEALSSRHASVKGKRPARRASREDEVEVDLGLAEQTEAGAEGGPGASAASKGDTGGLVNFETKYYRRGRGASGISLRSTVTEDVAMTGVDA